MRLGGARLVFGLLHLARGNDLFRVQPALPLERSLSEVSSGLGGCELTPCPCEVTALTRGERFAASYILAFNSSQRDDPSGQRCTDFPIGVLVDD